MSPPAVRVIPTPIMPSEVDVVIVGGGIVGVCTAMELAAKGQRVVLCEKGEIAAEQSSRNWGWVRKMGRDVGEIPLAIESLKIWEGMNRKVSEETGFRTAGIAYLCETPAVVAFYEKWLADSKQYGMDSRMLTSNQVEQLLPGSSRRWAGALYTASDARAEPHLAVPAMARAAQAAGVAILTNCAVRGIETKAGQVSGVVTEAGSIRCSAVVVAAGAWSRLFLGNMGIDFPQLKLLSSVSRTIPLDGPDYAVGAGDFAFRKRLDGGYTVAPRNASVASIVPDSFRLFFDFIPALRKQWKELRLKVNGQFLEEWRIPRSWSLDAETPFERVRILDPRPDNKILQESIRQLAKNFPFFENAQIAQSWAGLVDATPDAVPVMDALPSPKGLFLASGLSGHGFGLGPGAGRLMADIVVGDTPIVDPRPFRFGRFPRTARQVRKSAL